MGLLGTEKLLANRVWTRFYKTHPYIAWDLSKTEKSCFLSLGNLMCNRSQSRHFYETKCWANSSGYIRLFCLEQSQVSLMYHLGKNQLIFILYYKYYNYFTIKIPRTNKIELIYFHSKIKEKIYSFIITYINY